MSSNKINEGGERGYLPGVQTMPADEARFVELLAIGAPLEEIAEATGWSLSKVRHSLRSSRLLAAVASINLSSLHAVHVPRAIRTLGQFLEGFVDVAEYAENSPSDTGKGGTTSRTLRVTKEKVPVALRLEAAKTFLKMGGYDRPPEVKNPNEIKDLSEMRPDELRALVGTLEAELGSRAAPVSAPVEDAEPADDAESLARSML